MRALAVVTSGPRRDLASIDGLIDWVLQAPVEEVCWRITELGDMRQWAQAQKQATELRTRAVRLEMIALRKVALGGLAQKISGVPQLRSAARWLAEMSDEEFDTALNEIDGHKTPVALYRADVAQRNALDSSLSADRDDSQWEFRATRHRFQRKDAEVKSAATTLLSEIIEAGEPFTVSEAAERLADRLDLDIDVRSDTADGLREMVRTAIRQTESSAFDEARLPVAFTYQRTDGTYVRVPVAQATFGHLVAHEREVRDRAEASMRQADSLRALIEDGYRKLGIDQLDINFAPSQDRADLDEIMQSPLRQVIGAGRSDGYFTKVTP